LEATCVKFYEFGSPQNVLKVENKNIQRPMNGEVLVRMTRCPINPSDLIPIRGAYSHRISLPTIPGYEGIGIVEEVGPFSFSSAFRSACFAFTRGRYLARVC
jgi:NADPH:quinone reductase-like Zn-dependent oxidoreductase